MTQQSAPRIFVTQGDVAKALGVSQWTVSAALRRDPKVKAATREAVERKADEMGYVADAALTALVQQRYAKSEHSFASKIIVVTSGSIAELKRQNDWVDKVGRDSARLGYPLDYATIGKTQEEQMRWAKIFVAQGVKGILLAEPHLSADPWHDFSIVAIDRPTHVEPIHTISHDHFASMNLCLNEALKRGYSSPVFLEVEAISSSHPWLASFASMQKEFPRRIEPNLRISSHWTSKKLASWVRRSGIDLIFAHRVEWIKAMLEEEKIQVPNDVALCDLDLFSLDHRLSGIYQAQDMINALAVSTLITLMQRQERGFSRHPITLQVSGEWQEGETMPIKTSWQPSKA